MRETRQSQRLMPQLLRVIRRMVMMNVMMTLEYRGAFFVYMVNTVVSPVISLLVWLTVSEQGVRLPYSRSQFVTYYVLLSVVSMLTGTWLADWLAENIRLGGISVWLLRPAPYIVPDLSNNIGEKIVKLPLLLPLVILVGLFFRADLRLPTSLLLWVLFVVALILAATVAFLIDVLIGSLAFWVQDVKGIIRLKVLVGSFLAGQFVPLALFPPQLTGFMEAQPFRYTLSFPLEVVTGQLTVANLWQGFGWQITYCLLFWLTYRLLWHYGLRSYSAVGA